MKLFYRFMVIGISLLSMNSCKNKSGNEPPPEASSEMPLAYTEAYRPQFHFSPQEKWMNDPNGLVYHKGYYHLFYQYYPGDIVWGPMHWGHAVSKDMVFWEHKPIALYPDELGYIFSGSAVVDENNTSGFGTTDNPALVAIFTYHDIDGEKAGRTDFQTQGIAYSLDNGDTWTKFSKNPVIPNDEGIRDFRDPKVFWHEESSSWIMVLVAGDHAKFYQSPNLKEWTYLSDFGRTQGAHGGVWECPDLFPLKVDDGGEEKWVLLISINPGAPNGGSGTQYFIGNFNGTTFSSNQKEARWLDWGTDNYAGVTYNNVPSDDRIFIGWMSNWNYARDTPTTTWRSAMTVPRRLSLAKIGTAYELINFPLENFGTIMKSEMKKDLQILEGVDKRILFDHFNQAEVRFKTTSRNFQLTFLNELEEQLTLEMNGTEGIFSLDRSRSGHTDFQEQFGNPIQKMPIDNLPEGEYEVRILMDWSSVEVFINKGQYVMTAQLFPREPYKELQITNPISASLLFRDLEVSSADTIW